MRKLWWVLASTVLALSLMAGTAVRTLAVDQPSPPTALPPVAANPGAAYSDPAKGQLTVDSAAIFADARKMFGADRVGVPWVSKDELTLYVGVKDLRPEERGRWNRGKTQLVSVAHSRADFNAMQEQLTKQLGRPVSSGISFEGDLNESTHIVLLVRGDFTADEIQKIQTIVPADILRLKPGPNDAELTVNRNPAFPPWMGGHWLTYSYNGDCTSGFLFAGAFGYLGSTAGHCAPSGAQGAWLAIMGSNQVVVSNQAQNGYWVYPNLIWADYSLYSTNGWLALPAVKVSDSLNRSIISRVNDSVPIGTQLCFSGWKSNATVCGVQFVIDDGVQSVYNYGDGQFHYYDHQDCMSPISKPGDSGAPVYKLSSTDHAIAVGTLSYLHNDTQLACYTKIQLIVYFSGNDIVHI